MLDVLQMHGWVGTYQAPMPFLIQIPFYKFQESDTKINIIDLEYNKFLESYPIRLPDHIRASYSLCLKIDAFSPELMYMPACPLGANVI